MTRETKIGLLVGLAFIIVIGILLSDHMASTTDLPQARLDRSADGVRSSIATPTSGEPPITVVNTSGGGSVTPSQPIPTKRELVAQQTPVMATTTPTTTDSGATIAQADATDVPKTPIVIRESRPAAGAPHETTPVEEITEVTPEAQSDPLDNWMNDAKKKGVEIVPVKRGSPTAAGAKLTEYKAEAGDNLSKLAIKLLGSNSKANRDAIVAANPSLKDNPNMIVVGRKYQIPAPAVEAAEVSHAEAPAIRTTPVTKAPSEKQAAEPRQAGGQSAVYVVKENDTLWKIAARELGNGAAWTQIKELNQDVLKGNDQVVTNMKLRMPAKPLSAASAN